MILLVGFYRDPDAARQAELLDCLARNAANESIAEIHVFVEEAMAPPALAAAYRELAHRKVRLVPHGRRVTYRDLFQHANQHFDGRGSIIANADIFFDSTLGLLADLDLSGRLLCLTRWDVKPDGSSHLFEHPSSQDAWIFRAPIRDFVCDFPLGMLACDNRLAWEAEQAGLEISNPARSIRARHLHLSGVRRYSESNRLPGPVRSIEPAFLAPHRHPWEHGAPPGTPLAAIAFRETMGYTVARMEEGASSHNNDPRPFAAPPPALAGRPFTQVVSHRVSPVEIEFLGAGRLFVLVGTDWDGAQAATAWLREVGYKEALPPVETRKGTAFEVWSLVGAAGDRHVVPTQVMLVAEELVACTR